ncbi:MAG: hypothetical protein HY741_30030 [Chloroflexi bacterium]|nr:hypothetical protein [Chloroflexota bacterium]
MTERRYNQLIRLGAAVIAILLWFVSVQFSVDGFNFVLPKYRWVGYLLAVAVTMIEIVFNEEGMRHSLTIVTVGIVSYVYGIATNVMGIWVAQGSPDVTENPIALVFPAVVGFFLEVAPEPLLMWGLLGTGVRDLLGHLFAGTRGARHDDLEVYREADKEKTKGKRDWEEW